MPMDVRLTDVAQTLLDNLATRLASDGVSIPTRQYVHSGLIAHDFAGQKCVDAFIVSWTGSSQGDLGSSFQGQPIPIRCSMPLNHTFAVALLRCVPTIKTGGSAPSANELQASGESILDDAMTICAAIVDLANEDELLPQYKDRNAVAIISSTPIGPQGGVGGAVVQFAVSLV